MHTEGELIPLEEGYMVCGDVTKEVALEKIHAYEKTECDMDDNELFPASQLNKKYVGNVKYSKYSDQIFSWIDDMTDFPCWVGYV